jgi:hypothetical protein
MSPCEVLRVSSLSAVFILTGCYELNPANTNHHSLHTVKSCNIDSLQSPTAQDWSTQAGRLLVRGWAYDSANSSIPAVLRVQLASTTGTQHTVLSEAARRVERLDVANHFRDTRLLNAGFEAMLDANRLPSGSYTLSIVQYAPNAHSLCLNERTVQIK